MTIDAGSKVRSAFTEPQGNCIRINLGCGRDHRPGWVNVDGRPPADRIMDLNAHPWDLEDDTADYILMSHVLEHLVDPTGAIREAWRILRGDIGILEVLVPHHRHPNAYAVGHLTMYDENSLNHFIMDLGGRNDADTAFDEAFFHTHYEWPLPWPFALPLSRRFGCDVGLARLRNEYPPARIPIGRPVELHWILFPRKD